MNTMNNDTKAKVPTTKRRRAAACCCLQKLQLYFKLECTHVLSSARLLFPLPQSHSPRRTTATATHRKRCFCARRVSLLYEFSAFHVFFTLKMHKYLCGMSWLMLAYVGFYPCPPLLYSTLPHLLFLGNKTDVTHHLAGGPSPVGSNKHFMK